MEVKTIIKILSTISTIILGIGEVIRQVNRYNELGNSNNNDKKIEEKK